MQIIISGTPESCIDSMINALGDRIANQIDEEQRRAAMAEVLPTIPAQKKVGAAGTLDAETIFNFVRENPGMSTNALSVHFGHPGRLIRSHLLQLCKDGRVTTCLDSSRHSIWSAISVNSLKQQTAPVLTSIPEVTPQSNVKSVAAFVASNLGATSNDVAKFMRYDLATACGDLLVAANAGLAQRYRRANSLRNYWGGPVSSHALSDILEKGLYPVSINDDERSKSTTTLDGKPLAVGEAISRPKAILRFLQERKRVATVADISDALDMPRAVIWKAMASLMNRGLVVSAKGSNNRNTYGLASWTPKAVKKRAVKTVGQNTTELPDLLTAHLAARLDKVGVVAPPVLPNVAASDLASPSSPIASEDKPVPVFAPKRWFAKMFRAFPH